VSGDPTEEADRAHSNRFSHPAHPDRHPEEENAPHTIWRASLDDGKPQWIPEGFEPDVSPDGNRILMIRDAGGSVVHELRSVWVMGISGEGTKPILEGISGLQAPRWSPDGSQILYLSKTNYDLWIVDLKGTPFRDHLE
jgi:hypothetical protein